MKFKALILTLAFLIHNFCLPLQQSLAQTSADLPDSQVYFQKTVQQTKRKDYSAQIAELLKKMTLEEKLQGLAAARVSIAVISAPRCIKIGFQVAAIPISCGKSVAPRT